MYIENWINMKSSKTQKKKLLVRLLDFFKSVDLYGKNIKLTYEGDDTFKTHIGGFASFTILLLILSYFWLQLRVTIIMVFLN